MSARTTAQRVTPHQLFNLLQEQKNWPSGGAPALLDLRPAGPDGGKQRVIRGSQKATLSAEGEVVVPGASARSWMGRAVCLYDALPDSLEDHPVARALLRDAGTKQLLLLSEPFSAFEEVFPFLCAKASSSKAAKRHVMPSCVLPGLLYLGDLSDAAALPRLAEQLNVRAAVTALAELTPSLKAAVAEAPQVRHIWCNVRDVEEADIKAHFSTAYDAIEAAKTDGSAVFIHCSRGVSRSASLCIAYLMRKEGMSAKAARLHVEATRPIVLPNDGFWRCLQEYEKELTGQRSGVYIPAPKPKPREELEFELPPPWAADPAHTGARLVVEKHGEEIEALPVGDESMYTFGRSLTCDFPLEHPSLSRTHAAIVHHENGGLYLIDLKSSHGSFVNDKQIKPYEATLLREGAVVRFGASARTYRADAVGGVSQPLRTAHGETLDDGGAGSASSSRAVAEGPLMPGVERKRKYTPQDAKNKKRQRWLNGAKSSKQMSENERVARGAGSGSGCFGPGFD